MERKVNKIGDRLGVPMTDALKALGLAASDSVNVTLIDGQITPFVIRSSSCATNLHFQCIIF